MQDKIIFANTLRGPAAIAVVVNHYLGDFWNYHAAIANAIGLPPYVLEPPGVATLFHALEPFDLGQFGVGLFFLISGFVIPFSFCRYSRLGFVIARLFRLWPTYALGFLLTMSVVYFGDWLDAGTFPYSPREIGLHAVLGLRELTSTRNIDGVIWTLEVEITFYLICVIVAPWLRHGRWVVFFVPVGLLVYRLCLTDWAPAWVFLRQIKVLVDGHAECIIFMFAGVALNFHHRRLLSTVIAFTITTAAVAAFIVVFVIAGLGPLGWSYAAAALTFSIAMLWQNRVPDGAVWRFLANVSYPLYLTHCLAGYVLLELMLRAGAPPFVALGVTATIAMICAYLLHAYVELPTHNLGRRMARSFSLPAPEPPGLLSTAEAQVSAELPPTPASLCPSAIRRGDAP